MGLQRSEGVKPMEQLLRSYRETLYALHKVKIEADKEKNRLAAIPIDKRTMDDEMNLTQAQEYCDKINSFVSNVMYVISWLSKGHVPNPRRGIHRRSRVQREVPIDPLKMQSYANPAMTGSPTTLSDGERFAISEAMYNLTDREKECYMMKYGQCYSERQIADTLDIHHTTVREFIKKAEEKIKINLESNLFLQN